LHRFYAANVNAVAMQLFAAAIVHTAMRIAQGRIAAQHEMEPENLSVPKLFPKIAAASSSLVTAEIVFEATQRLNPKVALVKPDWYAMPFASTELRTVLRQIRTSRRRKRRYCAARRRWRSLPQPRGWD
ncbi:MAG: hypothetical protein ACT4PV_09795, partial [Planctomycetaceae bacterium]